MNFLVCWQIILFFIFVFNPATPQALVKEEQRQHLTTYQQKSSLTNQSIVPLADQIDDDQARFELAKIFSKYENSLNDALELYQFLLKKKPYQIELLLEISHIYTRQKKYQFVLSLLYPAIAKNPQNATLLVEAAHAEQNLKHAKQAQTLLLRALKLNKNSEPILLDYANTLILIGSFYQAEKIYKDLLMNQPHSLDLNLKLANVLASSQRYEEAEGIYKQLLIYHPQHPKILEALANLKVLEKDFQTALNITNSLLDRYPHEPSYLLLQANILYKKECYIEALIEFENLINYPKYTLQALIGAGKTYQKLGKYQKANFYFQQAHDSKPDLIEARFYLANQKITDQEFILQTVKETSKVEDFEKWANLYAENGIGGIAQFYEAALEIDPDYFPAKIGLAEYLSTHYQYNDSIELYLSLLETFPNNSKIMTAIARVLSWGKQYTCSLNWYDRLIDLNPQDPVPRREKARVAYWGYFFEQSMFTYQEFLKPTVDELLFNSLTKLEEKSSIGKIDHFLAGLASNFEGISEDMAKKLDAKDGENSYFNKQMEFCKKSILADGIDLISQAIINQSIYTGYEKFSSFFSEIAERLDPSQRIQIEEILIRYLPLYRIQKAAFLESYAKELDWQNYYFHALSVYQKLVDFNPGNEEALYGYAQDYCSLGLCKCSRRLYYHILNLSPGHDLVKMALERNLLQEHWLVKSNYFYWKEKGSGQFSQSQIARHQFDEILEGSLSCNFHYRFIQNLWIEHPFFNHKYYPAEGQTIEIDRNFNGFIKCAAAATRKNYFQKFVSRYTGYGNLWFNAYDYFNLGVGVERKNEIYNYFSLKQGIQATVYWLSVTSNLTHSWNMAATYRHLDYNDKNTLKHIEVITSYTFTNDPDIFKIILAGSWRNTAHLTESILNSKGQLVNVIHPYWTPKHYYSNSITLEYRHNFACFNYCEAPQRYLDIKITGEEDTARNPSLQILCEWKHEFMYHFGFELKGLIHQSKLWNAEGAWLTVYYRF